LLLTARQRRLARITPSIANIPDSVVGRSFDDQRKRGEHTHVEHSTASKRACGSRRRQSQRRHRDDEIAQPPRPRHVIVIMIGTVNSADRGSLDISVVTVVGRCGQQYRFVSAPRGFLFTVINAKLFQSRYNLLLDAGTTRQAR
jgi:hypothetical protein